MDAPVVRQLAAERYDAADGQLMAQQRQASSAALRVETAEQQA